MKCIHCNEPGAHPGTRKCTDLQACHGRQEYARGVADERARVVAWLRAKGWQVGKQQRVVMFTVADRVEGGKHEEKP